MPDHPISTVSYVPALIARRLADRSGPLADAHAEILNGTVLFADISGFTALTESLAERGPQGAEELTQFLNVYFGQLIDLITGHGGDVLKFAGDAVIAFWPAGDEDIATSTLRAAGCALLVQQHLHNFPAAAGVRLSLRIGIGAGPLSLFHVGGVNGRWEIVVSGAALTQMGAAKDQDQPGDVTLSREAYALVADDIDAQVLPAGAARVDRLRRVPAPVAPQPVPVVDPRAFLAYVPRAVVHHLLSQGGEWLAELRPVTVVFVNFPGLTPLTPIDRAQAVMRDLQAILFRYEAQINKLSVDDKGASLLGALGLPPLAHEDDAARAVNAAIEIREHLRGMDVHHAIGIASGLTFCGVIGNDTRREYTMIGDVVNLSARLMQAATDDVLCDQATFEGSRCPAAFDVLPEIHVKGKAAPLAVYRPRVAVRATPAASERRSAIVGRTSERETLRAMVDRAMAGTGGIVIVEGEAGAGKSSLIADLVDWTRAQGVTCLLGHGDAVEKATPYFAWRAIFETLMCIAPGWAREERRDQIARRVGARNDRWTPLLPLLNPVLVTDFAETAATEPLRERARAEATHGLLADLLDEWFAGVPFLVVVDDAQWMDSASWHLITDVSARGTPHVIVIGLRTGSDSAPEDLDALVAAASTQRLPIGRLSDADAIAIARETLDVDTLPEEVERIIKQRADGNPLFVEELVRTLKESGFLEIAQRECRLSPTAGDLRSVELPDTVQGAVMARIDRLAASQRTLLKVGSVAGRVFDRDVVGRLYPGQADAASIAMDLRALSALRIIEPVASDRSRNTYAFTQIVFQEVCYNVMLFSQRRQLHQAMAEWIEATAGGDLPRYYPLLAAHWREAVAGGGAEPALVAKAVDYLHKAGDQAVAQSADREAVALFTDALQLLDELPDTPDRAQMELRLRCAIGAPLTATRGFASPEVEQTYSRAWDLCQSMGESPERFGAILGLWVQYLVKANLTRARELATELMRSADAMGILDLQMMAHRAVGDTAYWTGDFATSVEHLDKAIALYQPERHRAAAIQKNSQDPGVVSRAIAAWPQWFLGDHDGAFARIDEAIALGESLGHSFSYAIAVHGKMFLHQFSGDAEQAKARADQLIELSRAEGFPMWLSAGTVLRGWAMSMMENPERGHAEMERGIADYRATGALLCLAYHISLLASGCARLGRFDEAVAHLDSALKATGASGEGWWRPELLRLRAELGLQANPGDRATAERLLREAISLAQRQRSRSLEQRAVGSLARLRA